MPRFPKCRCGRRMTLHTHKDKRPNGQWFTCVNCDGICDDCADYWKDFYPKEE